jgi:hypothetical protein
MERYYTQGYTVTGGASTNKYYSTVFLLFRSAPDGRHFKSTGLDDKLEAFGAYLLNTWEISVIHVVISRPRTLRLQHAC